MSSQNDLIDRVLELLNKTNVLQHLIIVGSWCIHFYGHHFQSPDLLPPIKTLDIEFDVSFLRHASLTVNIPDLLEELNFAITFRGEGFICLSHTDIVIEFLVPERGRPQTTPYKIPGFGINAQPLRYLSLLEEEIITVDYKGMPVKLPHPAHFSIHKLIISARRFKKEKAQRDREQALAVWDVLVATGEEEKLKAVYSGMPAKWRTSLKKVLDAISESYRLKGFG